MEKQAVNPNLILNDAIKAEITEFLPFIFFHGMELNFLNEFIAPRKFIFSSVNEFNQMLHDRNRFFEGKIKVTNFAGQTLHGNVISDKTVLRNIESLKLLTSCNGNADNYCFWNAKFNNIPSYSSPLKIKDGIEWYLAYLTNGAIGIEHYTQVFVQDYLLAELTAGDGGFEQAIGCKIEIE